MYIFCPITKTFNAEESRPFLIPHEIIQPIEIPILEFIHNTKCNHKTYILIQNTPCEFAVSTEELNTIKGLQLLWPLLQTKNIIRILAKLLTTSDDPITLEQKNGQTQPTCRPQSRLKGFRVRLDLAEKDFIELEQ